MSPRTQTIQKILLLLYAAIWLLLAVDPVSREDWALENLLVVALLAFLVLTRRRIQLSGFSSTCLFLFMTVHAIGAHYTYSLVPYDDWTERLLGVRLTEAFGFHRNNFDRLEHLLHGLLLTFPMRDALTPRAEKRGGRSYALAAMAVMLLSATYELMEWVTAELVAPDLGIAFLGSQGDQWDAQKDMSLGFAGAILSMTIAWMIMRRGRSY